MLGAQIPDPARLGIDVIFPAAMIGLAVGLITGRRELVAAIVGAGVAVVVALASSPAIGIVSRRGHRAGWSGSSSRHDRGRDRAARHAASAERYSMPGAHHDEPADPATAGRAPRRR